MLLVITRMSTTPRDTSPLSVGIADLLGRPGASKQVNLRAEVEGLAVPMARVREGTALDLDLRLDSLLEGILVSGSVRGDLALACRRCAAEVSGTLAVEVSEVFAFEGAPAEEDQYRVAGETLELEAMVRDAIVLELPLNPLCRPDCRGLCPECGEDRNRLDCGHGRGSGDARWAPLERLRGFLGADG